MPAVNLEILRLKGTNYIWSKRDFGGGKASLMGQQRTTIPDSLVSTEWLSNHLGETGLQVVDIRGYVKTTDLGGGRQHAEYTGARGEYEVGHIPGAVYVDWTADIIDPSATVKAQIAPPDGFQEAMESRGISDRTNVVVVDHTGGHFATRLWWALRYYGHDRCAVLDGGFTKWAAEGRPLTTDLPTAKRGRFTPRVRPELRVEAEDVLDASRKRSATIVDARDREQYAGEIFRGSRGGHVPGAVSIPAKSLIREDGTWKAVEEQRQILAEGGIGDEDRVIAYCNGGVTATAILFALHRTGHDSWANYDGSWNEWGERLELPAETGNTEVTN